MNIFNVYRTEQNQGLGKALNYDLSKYKNEIIICADSDDICDLERIKLRHGYLITHPEIAVVSSYIEVFDNEWRNPKKLKKLLLRNA